jgi:hypothetical protein
VVVTDLGAAGEMLKSRAQKVHGNRCTGTAETQAGMLGVG